MTKIVPKLNLNKHPRDCTDYSLVNAQNIVVNNDGTIITNEFDLSNNAFNAITKGGDIIVGSIACSTEIVLFLSNGNIYRVYDEPIINKRPNRPGAMPSIPVNYSLVVEDFNYHGGKIKGTYTYNVNGHLIISFSEYDTDDNVLVPLKVINLDNPEDDNRKFPICPEVVVPTVSNVRPTYDNWYKGIDYLFIRYKINDYDYTQWFALNKTVYCDKFYREAFIDTREGGLRSISVTENKDNETKTENILKFEKYTDISDKYEITNCGYKIVLTGIDERYKSYQLGIISATKDDTKAFRTNDIITSTYNINGHTVEKYFSDDLVKSYYNYYNIKNIVNYKNKLYISNYNEKSDENINNDVSITLVKNNIDINKNDNDENQIIINYKTVRISYGKSIHPDFKNEGEYICYIPELNKEDKNYNILNQYCGEFIPIMWLVDANGGYFLRFNPKNNEKPNYYDSEQYIAKFVFTFEWFQGSVLPMHIECMYKNIFYNDGKVYFAFFRNEDSLLFTKAKVYYTEHITPVSTNIGYDLSDVLINNDDVFIYYVNVSPQNRYTIEYSKINNSTVKGNLMFSTKIDTLNNKYVTINIDNLKYSFNILNTRSLIPDQYYSFYIHYIDKYGKITNGYPIKTAYGSDDIIQSVVKTKDVHKTNGIKITLYYDNNYSLVLYIDDTYKMKDYYELLCALRDTLYIELPSKYIIPVDRLYGDELVEQSASNEPRIQSFIQKYFDKFNSYDTNIIDTFNTNDTIENFFNPHDDNINTDLFTWAVYACKIEYNIEYDVTINYEEHEVVGKDNSIVYLNDTNNTIIKIPKTTYGILTEVLDSEEDITKFDNYTLAANVKSIPDNYIGWFISYEKFEPVSELSGYCRRENNNIVMYSVLFDINDKLHFNFNILKNDIDEYKILNYKLLPANSCNNLGYATKLIITLSNEDLDNFENGIYKLYNANYESLYNNTNKLLIPCTNIVYSTGEFNFDGTNGNVGDYNGCLSKIESIIYEEPSVMNTTTLNIHTLNGDILSKDSEQFITIVNHYNYNTEFNQLKRFNNNPKIYAQVTNPQDAQKNWKYNAIRYVEPQDTVDLFKQWYNPIDEQYPKVFLNYRVEDLNIDRFDKTIRSSNIIADETAEINWRKFNTDDYKNLTYNKGNITNLIGIGDKFYVHTEHSLFVLDVNNYLANGKKNVQLEDKEPFDVNFKEIFTTNVGFGGLQDDKAFIVGKFGYIWFDNDSKRFMRIDGDNDFAYIDNNIFKWYNDKIIKDIRFGEDIKYNRLFVKLNVDNDYSVLTYNYVLNEFISVYGAKSTIRDSIKFSEFVNSKNKLYIINDRYNEIYNLNYDEISKHIPKFAVIVNTGYEVIKYIEFLTYKLHCRQNIQTSIYDYSPVEGRTLIYSGDLLKIYNEYINTGNLDINCNHPLHEDVTETSSFNKLSDYQKPNFDLGNWNMNFLFDNSHTSTVKDAEENSRLYGNYFIIEFILSNDIKWEFEELNVQFTNKRI